MGDQLTFVPTQALGVLVPVLLLATGALCWLAWRRSGRRKTTGWLELLRFVLVGLVLGTLCQPEWLQTQPATERQTLVVLWDQSSSMLTRDMESPDGQAGVVHSRAEAIRSLLSEAAWDSADGDPVRNFDVVFEPFSSTLDTPHEGTDLGAALAQVLDTHPNLRGVVLLSDGDWNVGKSPVAAATRYRTRGVPLFAVGVGSQVPLPDLELHRMDAPTFGVVGKPLRIPFAVRSTMGQDREFSVTLSVDGKPAITKVVRVSAMSQAQRNLVWTPPKIGDYELTLRLPPVPGEKITDNNELSAPIAVRKEQLQVLVIESYPRWEYRYLRNALERDPGVQVSCLLFHPGLPKVGGGRAYIKRFPTDEELSRFDVVILGDVGVGPKQLTVAQTRAMRQLVSAQASGLVFIPGRAGLQASLAATPLADLIPVVTDPSQAGGIGSRTPGRFALTEAGQRSLLTRLADAEQSNADIWRRLPGFNWRAGILRAKVGSETLAVDDRVTAGTGRVPLIVTKTYGTGKVLYMGTDNAWRWREGVEDTYHYRFWAQVARWMAYRRQMAKGRSMRLFFSPDRPRTGDVVSLHANVQNALGGTLSDGIVVVQATGPSGKTRMVQLQPGEQDALGLFVGSFAPKESGTYSLVASCPTTGATVQADLSVQGAGRERQDRPARFDVLEEITTLGRGEMVSVSGVRGLLDHLATLPEPQPTVHRTRIWAHPIWCAILIVLLGMFWTGRKMIGAV